MKKVAVIVGSKTDKDQISKGLEVLDEFGVEYDFRVLSAHRDPEALDEFVIVHNIDNVLSTRGIGHAGEESTSILDVRSEVETTQLGKISSNATSRTGVLDAEGNHRVVPIERPALLYRGDHEGKRITLHSELTRGGVGLRHNLQNLLFGFAHDVFRDRGSTKLDRISSRFELAHIYFSIK